MTRHPSGFVLLELQLCMVLLCVFLASTFCLSSLCTTWSASWLKEETGTLLTMTRLSAMATNKDHSVSLYPHQVVCHFPNKSYSTEALQPLFFSFNVSGLGFKASGRTRQAGSMWVGPKNSSQKISLSVNTGKLSWFL